MAIATNTTTVFEAPSDSGRGSYLVFAADGVCLCGSRWVGFWHCECWDHVRWERDCKHIGRARRGELKPYAPAVAA